jgi:NADH-quinone oxidoreductase subunit J
MSLAFAIIAIVTVAAAVAAMSLRNLVHCALALTVAFAGLAAAYLQLGAQFVGFAQILVYVGAVAILIVFAILLTRGTEPPEQRIVSSGWLMGATAAFAVLAVLVYAIGKSSVTQNSLARPVSTSPPDVSVLQIGKALMTQFVLPLEVVGLLLTAALIGAVIIAMRDQPAAKMEDRGLKMEKSMEPSSILHPPSSEAGEGPP